MMHGDRTVARITHNFQNTKKKKSKKEMVPIVFGLLSQVNALEINNTPYDKKETNKQSTDTEHVTHALLFDLINPLCLFIKIGVAPFPTNHQYCVSKSRLTSRWVRAKPTLTCGVTGAVQGPHWRNQSLLKRLKHYTQIVSDARRIRTKSVLTVGVTGASRVPR